MGSPSRALHRFRFSCQFLWAEPDLEELNVAFLLFSRRCYPKRLNRGVFFSHINEQVDVGGACLAMPTGRLRALGFKPRTLNLGAKHTNHETLQQLFFSMWAMWKSLTHTVASSAWRSPLPPAAARNVSLMELFLWFLLLLFGVSLWWAEDLD